MKALFPKGLKRQNFQNWVRHWFLQIHVREIWKKDLHFSKLPKSYWKIRSKIKFFPKRLKSISNLFPKGLISHLDQWKTRNIMKFNTYIIVFEFWLHLSRILNNLICVWFELIYQRFYNNLLKVMRLTKDLLFKSLIFYARSKKSFKLLLFKINREIVLYLRKGSIIYETLIAKNS